MGTRSQRHLRHLLHMIDLIHSRYFYSTSSNPLLLRGAPDTACVSVSEFHAEAPQATASEGLAQGPYVSRAGFENRIPSDERQRIYQ